MIVSASLQVLGFARSWELTGLVLAAALVMPIAAVALAEWRLRRSE